jgi:hypothetical protein
MDQSRKRLGNLKIGFKGVRVLCASVDILRWLVGTNKALVRCQGAPALCEDVYEYGLGSIIFHVVIAMPFGIDEHKRILLVLV